MAHNQITFNTISVEEPGYLYVYLSYDGDSDNWVYFDDLKITHTPSNVVQYNDYYPFGLQTSSSWTRENSGNNYLYNGGSELNPATGVYETFYRGYDPALGRFQQVDPKAVLDNGMSVYQYAGGNPIRFNDPFGDKKVPNQLCDCFSISYSQNPFGPPKSGSSDWVSNISTVEENASRMSPGEFNAYYGIETGEDKVDLVQRSTTSIRDRGYITDILGDVAENGMAAGYQIGYLGGADGKLPIIEYVSTKLNGGEQGWWDKVKAWFSEDGHDSPEYKSYMADRAANPGFYKKWNDIGLTLGMFLPGGGLKDLFKIKGATQVGTKLLTQFSSRTIDDAVGYVMRNPNNVSHMFNNSAHNLGPLVGKLGGQENTIRSVLNAANGVLPSAGVFKDVMVTVEGYSVYLRGSVVNGVPKLGTMFIK